MTGIGALAQTDSTTVKRDSVERDAVECDSFRRDSVTCDSVRRDSIERDSIAWDKEMEGVTVKAQRQLVRQEIDRVGYDVQADEASKTESVLDMLRKVPMVTLDGEDNILVRGNANYKIYKNGHLDPSMTKNAKEILKAMPASSVKRIEVITDPGAREDAEGVNAILNIVMMDTRKMDGVTGSLTGAYSSLRSAGLGTYLATQLGKAIVSVDYGYNDMTTRSTASTGYVERTFVETGDTLRINTNGRNPGYIHYANLNASYDINARNLLSASFGGYFYKIDVQGDNHQAMFNGTGNPLYSFDEHYWLPSYNHHSWNGRLDYEHRTRREGERLTLSYMLALTRQHSEQESTYSNQQDVPFAYRGYLLHTREHFTEHTFQADYVRPLWTGHKVEVGAKYIDRRNSSDNRQDFYQTPQYPSYATAFDHTTQIAAAYVDYTYNVARWSARAGLRYEYSYMKGNYPDGQGQPFDRHLHDWVPQASVKYQVTARQSLKLGYATSINRPGITYLNPAVLNSPSRVDFGNAHLVSTRQQTLTLTYLYVGRRLTLQLAPHYSHYHNGIGLLVYSEGDVRYGTYGNNLRQHRWQMEGYAQWKPFDGTTLVANLNFTDNHARNLDAGLRLHTDDLYYYLNLSQKLPWRLTFSAYTYGQAGHTPQDIYAYTRSWNRYAFTLQRSFLSDGRLTVRLMANSPFHKHQHTRILTVQGDILGFGDSAFAPNGRYFRLSVSYRFGKLKASVKKTQTTIDNSDLLGGITKGK